MIKYSISKNFFTKFSEKIIKGNKFIKITKIA